MYQRQFFCPSCSSLAQMKNLGTTMELDSKGDTITCPAFGLYSSLAEHSTMGHVVLDLTNLAYQPTTKSREQTGHPKVTFAMSERRPRYPAHAPDMDEVKDEDDKPLVRPASIKEPAKDKSDALLLSVPPRPPEDLLLLPRPPPVARVQKRKGPQYGRIQQPDWNMKYPKTRASEQIFFNYGYKSRRRSPTQHQKQVVGRAQHEEPSS